MFRLSNYTVYFGHVGLKVEDINQVLHFILNLTSSSFLTHDSSLLRLEKKYLGILFSNLENGHNDVTVINKITT